MVLDLQMFSRRNRDEIDWQEFQARVDEFGFRWFYDAFNRLGEYLMGEIAADGLQLMDLHMLSDIWSPLDLHDSLTGWRGKLALAGNTWRYTCDTFRHLFVFPMDSVRVWGRMVWKGVRG